MTSSARQTYAQARDLLLARIVTTLSQDQDERFAAAWLTGSLGRGDADALSDLDLTVAVVDSHTSTLCARPWQVGAGTPPERLELFRQFGPPAVIHENHFNAPSGGTFTFVLYADSALVVDWTLVPAAQAERPALSRILFDKIGVRQAAPPAPESLAERAARAAERVAFFWLMAAVTAKYVARRDAVKVAHVLEMLHETLHEVERLLAGTAWQYQRASLSSLSPTTEAQVTVLRSLCQRMWGLMPDVMTLGGQVPMSPLTVIEHLLELV